MTSEGTHHPGQQPDEVSPGAGGPAPYGDRPAQQDNGYGVGNPDLGWAPRPPAGPGPAASAWPATNNDAPPTPAWGAAQVPQQTEAAPPGAWTPNSGGPAWPAEPEQPAWGGAAVEPTPEQPAWAQAEPAAPAWAPAGQPVRGAAQVPQAAPAWPAQDSPPPSGGWNDAPQDPAQSGGWANGTTAQDDRPQQPDWATSPGSAGQPGDWPAAGQQGEQPAWAAAEQSAPTWAQPEPPARGAAQVPAAPAASGWPGQNDPAQSAGWPAGSQDPAQSTGWPASSPDPAQSAGWPADSQDAAQSAGWPAGSAAQDGRQQRDWAAQQDDSGGWSGSGQQDDSGWSGNIQQDDRARRPEWTTPGGWDAPADQRPSAWPSSDEQAQGGEWSTRSAAGSATVPPPNDREETGWSPAEPTSTPPARATASVPGDGGPQSWSPATGNPPQWDTTNSSDRPAVPDVEPWSPGEAWGHSEPAASRAGDGWAADRAEEPPVYQPAPAPGISPGNAVPLPPQEQRVPGASLAAAPPGNYVPPAQYGPVSEQPVHAEQSAREGGGTPAYEPEQSGWGPAAARHEEPHSPAGPVIPTPRTSPESAGWAGADAASGSVSASASVPHASRITPSADQPLLPAGAPAPQPRVYGRPTRPEPADAPEQDGSNGYPGDQAPRFGEGPETGFGPGPETRFGPEAGFDDRDHPAGPFSGAAPVAPAATPPAFPPGLPAFVDAPATDRPVNGVRPHSGGERPADRFGAPAAGAATVNGAASGAATVNGAGFGPAPMVEPAPGGAFPPAFPPPPQQSGPSWGQPGPDQDQGRFEAFKPIAEPSAEAPTPKVRNGRVLAAVLVAAVLILAVPLGLLALLGKVGGSDPAPAFAVGSCVKQAGNGADEVDCGAEGAFTIVSRVDAKEKCADPAQPYVVLPGDGPNRVLCLKPAAG